MKRHGIIPVLLVLGWMPLLSASDINLASGVTVAPGEWATLPVVLAHPAPEGGVFVTLSSSDPSILTVNPNLVLIRAGETTPARQAQVSGVNFGEANVFASAASLSGDTQIVRVSGALLGADTTEVQQGTTRNITFVLTAPSPVDLVVSLVSENPDISSVPASVLFPANGINLTVPITGVRAGSTVIHIGSGLSIAQKNLTVTVADAGSITIPSDLTAQLGSTIPFPVVLGAPASGYGVTIALASSDESKVTISPSSVFVPAGLTAPATQPRVAANDIGVSTISAVAPGYSTASGKVSVSATLTFSPNNLTINGNTPQRLVLALSASAPWVTGLTAQLSSSNPGVATVAPSTNFYPDGSAFTSVIVFVTPVGPGTTVIHASSPYIAETTATITVISGNPGSPASIVAVSGTPQSANVNTAFGSPFSVAVKDVNGNALQGIEVQFQAPAAGASGAFAGNANSAVTNALGIATSAAFVANGNAGPFVVAATVAGVSAPASFLLTNSVSAPVAIQLASGIRVGPGQAAVFPVSLSAGAPPGGVTIALTSSDAGKVTVAPSPVFIPAGSNTPATQPVVTGVDFGDVSISASAAGLLSASQGVQVGATLAFQPNTLAIHTGTSQTITLTLSAPAPASGLQVTLSSDNAGVATVPATATFPAGASVASLDVKGVSAGSAVITAASSAPNVVSGKATAAVTAGTDIGLTSGITVAPGEWATLAVTLAKPAPEGGVFINLTASDISVLTVNPSLVLVRAGETQPVRQPQVTGVAFGSATVSAAAAGLAGDTQTILVSASLVGPDSITIQRGETQSPTFVLTAPATTPFSISVVSDNPATVSVPPSVVIPAGASGVRIPISGLSPGSTVVHIGGPPAIAQRDLTVMCVATAGISLASSLDVPLGTTAPFNITLGSPAPAYGTTIAATSSDESKVTISPSSVFVAAGQTTPVIQPRVTASDIGTSTITASAPGYTTASTAVSVSAVLTFLPANLTITGTTSQRLVLALSASAPWGTGLTVQLRSSNPAVATIAPTVNFYPDGSAFSSTIVLVKPVGPGTTVIHAGAPPYVGDVIATITVVD